MSVNQKNQKSSIQVLFKSGIIGSLRATISLPLQHPFDALKTNMQAHQTNLITTARMMLQRKGWRSFYNGFSMNLLRVMIKQAYRWPLWISFQQFYKRLLPNSFEIIRQSITGFSISLCELLIVCPFQRIKVWLMTTRTQDQTKYKYYYDKKFSIKDLYTGFTSLLIKQGLSWSSFLTATQIAKNQMKRYKNKDQLNQFDLFLVSIPVSIINTAFIMPIDCIKTHYQKFQESSQKFSFVQKVKKMVQKYGVRGLYLGWSARLIQYTIQSVFTLVVIEQLQKQYRKTLSK